MCFSSNNILPFLCPIACLTLSVFTEGRGSTWLKEWVNCEISKWIVLPATGFSCVAFVFPLQFLWWPLESGFGWSPVLGAKVRIQQSQVVGESGTIEGACCLQWNRFGMSEKSPRRWFFQTFKSTKLSWSGEQEVTRGQAFKGGKSFGSRRNHISTEKCALYEPIYIPQHVSYVWERMRLWALAFSDNHCLRIMCNRAQRRQWGVTCFPNFTSECSHAFSQVHIAVSVWPLGPLLAPWVRSLGSTTV